MSNNELTRLDTVKKLQEKRVTRQQAADLLGLSVRQIQRLYTAYKALGVDALVSKRRNVPSIDVIPTASKNTSCT